MYVCMLVCMYVCRPMYVCIAYFQANGTTGSCPFSRPYLPFTLVSHFSPLSHIRRYRDWFRFSQQVYIVLKASGSN